MALSIFCRLIPSSFDNMMLKFETMEDRDAVVALAPIAHGGATLNLVRGEEAKNRTILEHS